MLAMCQAPQDNYSAPNNVHSSPDTIEEVLDREKFRYQRMHDLVKIWEANGLFLDTRT